MTRRTLTGFVGIVGSLAIWGLLAVGPMSETPLPHPWEVFTAAIGLFQDPTFWGTLTVTLTIALKGFAMAVIVGVILGLLIGWFSFLGDATSFIIDFLKPIPPIVIMPLAVLVLGPTQQMAEFLVFYGCVLPIIYQSAAGVRETDPIAVQTSRSYGVRTPEILARVVFPSASAFIATALRTAIPISLIVAVVAGLLGGGPGLGHALQRALSSNSVPEIYALVGVLGIFGLLFLIIGER